MIKANSWKVLILTGQWDKIDKVREYLKESEDIDHFEIECDGNIYRISAGEFYVFESALYVENDIMKILELVE